MASPKKRRRGQRRSTAVRGHNQEDKAPEPSFILQLESWPAGSERTLPKRTGDQLAVRRRRETIKCVFSRLSSFPGNIRVTRTRLGLLSLSHTHTQPSVRSSHAANATDASNGGGARRDATNFGQKRQKAAEPGVRCAAHDGRAHLIPFKRRLAVGGRAHAPLPLRAHESRAKMSGRSLVRGSASGARPDV